VPLQADLGSSIAFVTTHWSVLLAAQGESATADDALEKLCRIYWRPLYAFIRRQGFGPEEAQEGQPIAIAGLWDLVFGQGGRAGKTNKLYFDAGPDAENFAGNGLFGVIRPEKRHQCH
jgi:hypothetical protein